MPKKRLCTFSPGDPESGCGAAILAGAQSPQIKRQPRKCAKLQKAAKTGHFLGAGGSPAHGTGGQEIFFAATDIATSRHFCANGQMWLIVTVFSWRWGFAQQAPDFDDLLCKRRTYCAE
jgi:hypothetical protein